MVANFFVKIFPYIFVFSFIYFEFSPVFFYENELVKPYLSFLIVYSWICHDETESLVSFDFKETWIKFIIYLVVYFVIIYLCNYFFENSDYNFGKNIFSLILTILLFPLFFSLIEKLTIRFGRHDN